MITERYYDRPQADIGVEKEPAKMQFVVAKAIDGIIEQRDHSRQLHTLLAQNSYELHVRDHVDNYYLNFPECSYHDADRAMLCSRWDPRWHRDYNIKIGCLYLAEERARARGVRYKEIETNCREWKHLYDPTDVGRMKIGLLTLFEPFEPIDVTGVDIDEIGAWTGQDLSNLHIQRHDSRPMKVYISDWRAPKITSNGPLVVVIGIAPSHDYAINLANIKAKSLTVCISGRVRINLTGAISEQCIRGNHRAAQIHLNGKLIQPIFDPSIRFFWASIERRKLIVPRHLDLFLDTPRCSSSLQRRLMASLSRMKSASQCTC